MNNDMPSVVIEKGYESAVENHEAEKAVDPVKVLEVQEKMTEHAIADGKDRYAKALAIVAILKKLDIEGTPHQLEMIQYQIDEKEAMYGKLEAQKKTAVLERAPDANEKLEGLEMKASAQWTQLVGEQNNLNTLGLNVIYEGALPAKYNGSEEGVMIADTQVIIDDIKKEGNVEHVKILFNYLSSLQKYLGKLDDVALAKGEVAHHGATEFLKFVEQARLLAGEKKGVEGPVTKVVETVFGETKKVEVAAKTIGEHVEVPTEKNFEGVKEIKGITMIVARDSGSGEYTVKLPQGDAQFTIGKDKKIAELVVEKMFQTAPFAKNAEDLYTRMQKLSKKLGYNFEFTKVETVKVSEEPLPQTEQRTEGVVAVKVAEYQPTIGEQESGMAFDLIHDSGFKSNIPWLTTLQSKNPELFGGKATTDRLENCKQLLMWGKEDLITASVYADSLGNLAKTVADMEAGFVASGKPFTAEDHKWFASILDSMYESTTIGLTKSKSFEEPLKSQFQKALTALESSVSHFRKTLSEEKPKQKGVGGFAAHES